MNDMELVKIGDAVRAIKKAVGTGDPACQAAVLAVQYETPKADAVPVVRCKDCVYYHKPHVQRKDGTECDISEVPDEYKPWPLTNLCTGDYGINVGGKCEYDNSYAPYDDDKTVFRQPDDFCSRGRRNE